MNTSLPFLTIYPFVFREVITCSTPCQIHEGIGWYKFIDILSQYRKAAHYNVTHRRRQNFYALNSKDWQLLAAPPLNILSKFDKVDDAIDANAEIASRILTSGLQSFGLNTEPSDVNMDWRGMAKPADMDKARQTLRQFYRDWSAEGTNEREQCYTPVLDDLSRTFKDVLDKSLVNVLIPGAGLGRLVYETCKLGYTVEGNELSYHQLLASNWILNHVGPAEQFHLYPFATTFSNNTKLEHQLKAVIVPDVHPGVELHRLSMETQNPALDRMSMTAADFILLYGEASQKHRFDAVVTVFFLDTAPNAIRYVETIRSCLKPGGMWINLGPLLWHFEERSPSIRVDAQVAENTYPSGIGEPGSVELTEEEILLLIEKMGFQIIAHESRADATGYIQDPESMAQNLYKISHWTAKSVS